MMLLATLTRTMAIFLPALLSLSAPCSARVKECRKVAFNLTSTCLNSRVDQGAEGCLQSCQNQFQHLFEIIGYGTDGRLKPKPLHNQPPVSYKGAKSSIDQPSDKKRLLSALFNFEPCLARLYMCLNNIEGQIMSSVPPRTQVCARTSCLDSSSSSAVGAQRCSCKATFRLERAYISWRKPLDFGPFRCDTESICKRLNHLLTSKFSCVDHTVLESDLGCTGPVDSNCPCNQNGEGVCTQIAWPSPGTQSEPVSFRTKADPPEGFDDTMESYNRYLCHFTPVWAKHRLDSVLVNQIHGCNVRPAHRIKRMRSDTAAGTSTGSFDLKSQYANRKITERLGAPSESCFTNHPSTYQSADILNLATASVPGDSLGFGNALGFGNIDFDTIESNQLSQLHHGQQPAIMDLEFAVLNDLTQPQGSQTDILPNESMEWPSNIPPICPWPGTFYGTGPSADGHARPNFPWISDGVTSSDTNLDWRQELQLQSAQPISSLAPVNRLMTTSQVFHFDDLLTSNTIEQIGSAANGPSSSVDIFSELSAMITPQRVTANLSPPANAEVADDDADDDIFSEEIAAELLGFL